MPNIEFGVLLPHFTAHLSRQHLLDSVHVAESEGFDSAWVRDHLFISPGHREHGGISDPGLITEGILTLASLSSITSSIKLGAAIITPHRHPLKVAQLFATLDYLTDGRSIMGVGTGWDPAEFAAVGIPFNERLGRLRETVEVCRRAWADEEFYYHGSFYDIPSALVQPQPPQGQVPIWYGGLSFKAVELAVELGTGWLPSRIPYDRLASRINRAKELLGSEKCAEFTFAVMPQTALGATSDQALARFDLPRVLSEAQSRKPISGKRDKLSVQDLEGYIIWGTPDDLCAQIERFMELGVTHIVFDMRANFESLTGWMRTLGDSVLSKFRM